MAGYILLAGGAEFNGSMSVTDMRALELAGGRDASVSIIPTAAAPNHQHLHAGSVGVNWFRGLGACHVETLPIIDKVSANSAELATHISQSRLLYFTSGFVGFLCRTMVNTLCWQAILAAHEAGAVIAGSGAGAMAMGQHIYDPVVRKVSYGLCLLPDTCILPHHDVFGYGWVDRLTLQLPQTVLLGIDERTSLLDDGKDARNEDRRAWNVYGQGTVTCYRAGVPIVYKTGQHINDSFREQV